MSKNVVARGSSSTSSAEELHLQALEANRVGNRGQVALIQALRVLHESGGVKELGFPTIAAYAGKYFLYGRTETYEFVRVAKALDELPRCLEAFSEGRVCWSALRAIARVASSETEEEWLAFAAKHPVARLHAEVQEAVAKKRDTPRKEGYGLPAIKKKIEMSFDASEYEKVRKLLREFADKAAEKLGVEHVGMGPALLFLSEQLLAKKGEIEDRLDQGRPVEYGVIYQTCPSCQRAGVHTPDGLVEVSREEIDRIEGEAVVERLDGVGDTPIKRDTPVKYDTGEDRGAPPAIDRPTPSSMAKQIHLRDGEQCANPLCSHSSDQCHHIQFRSEGGKTLPWNLISVCATCHALVHAGLLKVTGIAGQEPHWQPCSVSIVSNLSRDTIAADSLPVFRIESARADSAGSQHAEDVHSALRNMGLRKADAQARVNKATELLGSDPHTIEDLLLTALAGRVRRHSARAEHSLRS